VTTTETPSFSAKARLIATGGNTSLPDIYQDNPATDSRCHLGHLVRGLGKEMETAPTIPDGAIADAPAAARGSQQAGLRS
jgi:hypothetical protein